MPFAESKSTALQCELDEVQEEPSRLAQQVGGQFSCESEPLLFLSLEVREKQG